MEEQAVTRLREVEIAVDRTGVATPIGIVDPVVVGGTTLTRASLRDAEFVRDGDVRIGDAISVVRSNSATLQIASVLPLLRTGDEQPVRLPHLCPVCGCDLRQRGRALVCANAACPPQLAARIAQIATPEAFDIPQLDAPTIDRLIETRLVTTPSDVFKLKERDLLGAGFGAPVVRALLESIARAKNVSLERLLVAMTAIPPSAAESLASHARSLARVKRLVAGSIARLPGVTVDAAEAVINFVREPRNRRTLAQMARAGVTTARVPALRHQ